MTPASTTPPARTTPLDRDTVIDVAIDLVSRAGGAGFSMRKLATTLGVRPATVYWHVGNRADLVDAIAERAVSGLPLRASRGRTPVQRVVAAGVELRQRVQRRPRLLEFLGREGKVGVLFLPLRDLCLTEARDLGFAPRDAVRRARAIVFHVAGFVTVELGLASYHPTPGVDVVDGTGVAGMAAPPGLEAAMSEFEPDALFEFSLRALAGALLAP